MDAWFRQLTSRKMAFDVNAFRLARKSHRIHHALRMTDHTLILPLLASYLAGSIPFAFIAARLKGVDIRTVGSGNVGATNVFRAVSRPLGMIVFILDAAKGFVSAYTLPRLFLSPPDGASFFALGLTCGVAAILGHTWPVWLRFKGGKGVATGAGVLLAVAAPIAGIAFAAWLIAFILSRYVSMASMAAALAAALASWAIHGSADIRPYLLTLAALFIVWRHRSNIRRLIAGIEPRAWDRPSEGAPG